MENITNSGNLPKFIPLPLINVTAICEYIDKYFNKEIYNVPLRGEELQIKKFTWEYIGDNNEGNTKNTTT